MSVLLDHRYWFNPNPVPLGPSLVGAVFIFFAWFLIAGLVLYGVSRTVYKKDALLRPELARFGRAVAMTGVLGFMLLFFAYEQVPLFAMRFWLIPLAAWFIYRLAAFTVFIVRDHPKAKESAAERERFERWMPKKR